MIPFPLTPYDLPRCDMLWLPFLLALQVFFDLSLTRSALVTSASAFSQTLW